MRHFVMLVCSLLFFLPMQSEAQDAGASDFEPVQTPRTQRCLTRQSSGATAILLPIQKQVAMPLGITKCRKGIHLQRSQPNSNLLKYPST